MKAPLNLPREIAVLPNQAGVPAAIIRKGARRRVLQAKDTWRIDDEWWRQQVSRLYFLVELEGGIRLTVFQDILSGKWHEQRG